MEETNIENKTKENRKETRQKEQAEIEQYLDWYCDAPWKTETKRKSAESAKTKNKQASRTQQCEEGKETIQDEAAEERQQRKEKAQTEEIKLPRTTTAKHYRGTCQSTTPPQR